MTSRAITKKSRITQADLRGLVRNVKGKYGKEVIIVLTHFSVYVGCVYDEINSDKGDLYPATQELGKKIARKFTTSETWESPTEVDVEAPSEGLSGHELTTIREGNKPAAIVQGFGNFRKDNLEKYTNMKILSVSPTWAQPSGRDGRLLYAGRGGSSLIWRLH
jgi:hypothetical protein